MTQPPFDPAATFRLLPFGGCHNFRSVSGWRTADGRVVADGLLFRSDGLDALTDADQQRIAALNITHAFDLRAAAERQRAPSRWPVTHMPAIWSGAESAAEAGLTAMMQRQGLSAADFHTAMAGVYARFPDDLADAVAALGEAILTGGNRATLVHCTAGKDRTGFAVAMLLLAIGVRAEDVLADFLLSNASFAAARVRFNIGGRLDAVEAGAPGALANMVGVHPEYLAAATQRIAADCGSIDAWLARRAGLDDARRAQLAARLLA